MSKSVLFVSGTPWASKWYRMEMPQQELARQGYTTESIMFYTIDPYTLIGNKPVKQIDSDDITYIPIDITKADIIVFQMAWHETMLDIIKRVKVKGITTIMEIDDDYLHLPANNPAFNSFHPRTRLMKTDEGERTFVRQQYQYKLTHTKHGVRYVRDKDVEPRINFAIDNLKKSMETVDLLQTSTPELAENYSMFNKNIVVLPNYIDTKMYTPNISTGTKVLAVGWYGTKTHTDDLQIVDGLIPSGGCTLFLIGVEDLVEKEKLFRGNSNLILQPPFGDIANLPEGIKHIDIGICPLEDNKFNRGKSYIKALEFNGMGIPVICSDVAPYSRYIKHGENGYLVKGNKTKFWTRYLNELLTNQTTRLTMSNKAVEEASKYDISKHIGEWIGAYQL